jgi:hypothetical protein
MYGFSVRVRQRSERMVDAVWEGGCVLQPVCVWGGEEEGRGVPGGSVRVRVRACVRV